MVWMHGSPRAYRIDLLFVSCQGNRQVATRKRCWREESRRTVDGRCCGRGSRRSQARNAHKQSTPLIINVRCRVIDLCCAPRRVAPSRLLLTIDRHHTISYLILHLRSVIPLRRRVLFSTPLFLFCAGSEGWIRPPHLQKRIRKILLTFHFRSSFERGRRNVTRSSPVFPDTFCQNRLL